MTSEELYLQRNALLHRATSYKAKTKTGKVDKGATARERSRCFIEAEKITQQLEELWAARSIYPEPDANLYAWNRWGEYMPSHALQGSDGISHRYLPLREWQPSEIRIDTLSPVERLRKQEIKLSREEIDFHQAMNRLYEGLAP